MIGVVYLMMIRPQAEERSKKTMDPDADWI